MQIISRISTVSYNKKSKNELSRIAFLDGLRGIAIILVILGHAKSTMNLDSHFLESTAFLWGNAGLGVRIFFVMSGYLITLILSKELTREKTINFKWFYFKRALRLFPSFYAFLLIVFFIAKFTSVEILPHEFLSAITFTWNYSSIWFPDGTIEGSWFLGHLWSLSLEEQFYLVWPFLFVALPKKKLVYCVGLFVITSPFIRVFSYFLFPSQRGILGMMFHTAIDGVLVGCFFALIADLGFGKWVFEKVNAASCLFGIILLPALISPVINNFISGYSISIGRTIDGICIGILIFLLHRRPEISLNRVLSSKVLVYVGRISYSLYLWQQLFLTNLNTTMSGAFPVNIVFCFFAALLSYYLIEMPFLRLKHNIFIRKLAGAY